MRGLEGDLVAFNLAERFFQEATFSVGAYGFLYIKNGAVQGAKLRFSIAVDLGKQMFLFEEDFGDGAALEAKISANY